MASAKGHTDLLRQFGLQRNPFTDRTAEKTGLDDLSLYVRSDLQGFQPSGESRGMPGMWEAQPAESKLGISVGNVPTCQEREHGPASLPFFGSTCLKA